MSRLATWPLVGGSSQDEGQEESRSHPEKDEEIEIKCQLPALHVLLWQRGCSAEAGSAEAGRTMLRAHLS